MGRRIKKQISITLSARALAILERMASDQGTDRSNMVELLLLGKPDRVVKGSPKPRKDWDEMSVKLDRALNDIDEAQKRLKGKF